MKKENVTTIIVQAHPGAKKNQVLRFEDGAWNIKIAAPPVEGKANKKLIEFLSEVLDVPKGHITIEKGSTSKRKMIMVEGITQQEVDRKLREEIA